MAAKKQTPEQRRAAKMAKLDPDNWKSAKDVMDERQAAFLKRKREEDGESSDAPLVEPEKPKAEQESQKPKSKKQKTVDNKTQSSSSNANAQETEEQRIQRRKEAKAAKKERKKEQKMKAKEKLDRQKTQKKEAKQQQGQSISGDLRDKKSKKSKSKRASDGKEKDTESNDADAVSDEDVAEAIEIDGEEAFCNGQKLDDDNSSNEASEHDADEVFSPLHDSGVSSNSSIQPTLIDNPPADKDKTSSTSMPGLPARSDNRPRDTSSEAKAEVQDSGATDDPRQRLQAAISAFRAERKADNGPKSRGELLEQRRRQEERRRAEKKEQKRREKEEAARKQEQEIAKRFSPGGSGSLLGSPRSPLVDTDTNNFSFGRVAFGDGSSLDAETQKKKGPSDPATALKAAQAKKQRISGLDSEKQATIQEKDMWANARKRANGEKVKDDSSLLKKALKRHEGQKRKSEKEWNERKEGVQKSMDMKQKKRTDNLAKRKDEKHSKGKKGKMKRPGFEGSFKGRTGGGKKS